MKHDHGKLPRNNKETELPQSEGTKILMIVDIDMRA